MYRLARLDCRMLLHGRVEAAPSGLQFGPPSARYVQAITHVCNLAAKHGHAVTTSRSDSRLRCKYLIDMLRNKCMAPLQQRSCEMSGALQ